MPQSLILVVRDKNITCWEFYYDSDLGYWKLRFQTTAATIPLVSVTEDNLFYCEPLNGWGISKSQWLRMCDLAKTVRLLVDPFKHGEHIEDAAL